MCEHKFAPKVLKLVVNINLSGCHLKYELFSSNFEWFFTPDKKLGIHMVLSWENRQKIWYSGVRYSGGYFTLFLHKFQLSIFRSDNIPDASRGRSVDHFVGQKSSSIKIDWGRCSLHLTQTSRKKREKATAEADDSG